MVTSLGQECDIEEQLGLLYLTMETSWYAVRCTMPYIGLPGGGDAVITENTLTKRIGMDVLAQFEAFVLKVRGRQWTLAWIILIVLWASPTMVMCCVRHCHSVRAGRRCARRREPCRHTDSAVSTTHNIPGFRGRNAGSYGQVGDGFRKFYGLQHPVGTCQNFSLYRFSRALKRVSCGVFGQPICTQDACEGPVSSRCKGGLGERPT